LVPLTFFFFSSPPTSIRQLRVYIPPPQQWMTWWAFFYVEPPVENVASGRSRVGIGLIFKLSFLSLEFFWSVVLVVFPWQPHHIMIETGVLLLSPISRFPGLIPFLEECFFGESPKPTFSIFWKFFFRSLLNFNSLDVPPPHVFLRSRPLSFRLLPESLYTSQISNRTSTDQDPKDSSSSFQPSLLHSGLKSSPVGTILRRSGIFDIGLALHLTGEFFVLELLSSCKFCVVVRTQSRFIITPWHLFAPRAFLWLRYFSSYTPGSDPSSLFLFDPSPLSYGPPRSLLFGHSPLRPFFYRPLGFPFFCLLRSCLWNFLRFWSRLKPGSPCDYLLFYVIFFSLAQTLLLAYPFFTPARVVEGSFSI